MVLVDTNVVFSLLVANTPWSALARDLYAVDTDWHTESHAFPELTNILRRYVQVGELTRAQAFAALRDAEERLASNARVVRHDEALRMALQFKTSGYDARFLALAELLGVALVTEDIKLRRAAPALTQSIAQALAA